MHSICVCVCLSVCICDCVYVYIYVSASALQYMRTKNVSHMDLKPQNVLLASTTSPILKIAGHYIVINDSVIVVFFNCRWLWSHVQLVDDVVGRFRLCALPAWWDWCSAQSAWLSAVHGTRAVDSPTIQRESWPMVSWRYSLWSVVLFFCILLFLLFRLYAADNMLWWFCWFR